MLKEHQAGATAADLCRKHGISDATFYTWRSKYGGMDVSDARKLKGLEEENAKLKRLLAEQMLDVATLKEMLAKTYGPPRPQGLSRPGLISLRQRIRSQGTSALAKMEIRAPRSL